VLGRAVPRDHPLVVEAHELDHVSDVGLCLDPARRGPQTPGKDGMVDDSPFGFEPRGDVARKAEVGGVIAMQVSDLTPADLESELPPPAWAGVDARPGRDDLGDLAAWGGWLLNVRRSRLVVWHVHQGYKFK